MGQTANEESVAAFLEDVLARYSQISEQRQFGRWWHSLAVAKLAISYSRQPAMVRPPVPVIDLAPEEADLRESQRIAEQRELLSAKRRAEFLEAQNEGQLECINTLTKTNYDLTTALLCTTKAKVKIVDHRQGRVARVEDGHVVVAYETSAGRVEHVYGKSQFVDGKLPDEGDWVEARAFVAFLPGPVRSVARVQADSEQADEFRAFREKRTKGPTILRKRTD